MAEAQRAVLTIIDGLSYEVFEHLDLPHLSTLGPLGAYCRELWGPPPAQPQWFHSCSVDNVALMTGTVLWNPHDQQLQSVFSSLGPCVHVAGSPAYHSLNVDYCFSALESLPDQKVLDRALDFLQEVDPVFLCIRLQDGGRAGASIRDGEDIPHLWADDSPYPAAVQRADALVGELMAALRAQGRWEDTVFAVCGNHGQADTGGFPPLSEKSWRTPLVLTGPGIQPGVVLEYAEAIDVAPTLCCLLDLFPPTESQGRVLNELLEDFEDSPEPQSAPLREINHTLLACEMLRERIARARTSSERRFDRHLDRATARARVLLWEAEQLYYGLEEMPAWGELGTVEELLITNLRAYELFCQAEELLSAAPLSLPFTER